VNQREWHCVGQCRYAVKNLLIHPMTWNNATNYKLRETADANSRFCTSMMG